MAPGINCSARDSVEACPNPGLHCCRLADLAPGSRARVVAVDDNGSPATADRLVDLGFVPGATVEVVRRAPLRDPVIYRVKDYEICLRRAQAAAIRAVVVA